MIGAPEKKLRSAKAKKETGEGRVRMSDCYLCGHSPVKTTFTINTQGCQVECSSCGEYTISHSVRLGIENTPEWNQQRPTLARAARRNFDAGTPLNLNTEADWLKAIAKAAKSQG